MTTPESAGKSTPNRAERARNWLVEMLPDQHGKGGDRAALARLRRASNPTEAALDPATIALHRILGGAGNPDGLLRTAAIAATLSHVRADDPSATAAAQLGRVSEGRRVMSELRFRRLLTDTHEPRRAMIACRRLVALLGGETNAADLAGSMLNWLERDLPFPNARERSDKRLLRWSLDYYGAEIGAEAASTTDA